MACLKISESYWLGRGVFNGLGLSQLEERYTWPLSPATSKYISDGTLFRFTERLKLKLHEAWSQAVNEQDHDVQIEIANYIIKDWGGIKSLKESTLLKHINLAKRLANDANSPKSIPLGGVASYSKLLSVADPNRFAIFDARVAVSLVAIQLLSETKEGIHLGYLDGRNNLVGHSGKKVGFSFDSRFIKSNTRFQNWYKPSSKLVYAEYLTLLQNIALDLDVPISKLEMSLFADADALVELCNQHF